MNRSEPRKSNWTTNNNVEKFWLGNKIVYHRINQINKRMTRTVCECKNLQRTNQKRECLWLVEAAANRHRHLPTARYPACRSPLVSLLMACSISCPAMAAYAWNVARSWAKLREHNTTLNSDSSVPQRFSPACYVTQFSRQAYRLLFTADRLRIRQCLELTSSYSAEETLIESNLLKCQNFKRGD